LGDFEDFGVLEDVGDLGLLGNNWADLEHLGQLAIGKQTRRQLKRTK